MNFILSRGEKIDYKTVCKDQIISMIMKNAEKMGWRIKQKKSNVFVLKKNINKMSEKEHDTENLVDMILDINNFGK
jgi:hypothetical protein